MANQRKMVEVEVIAEPADDLAALSRRPISGRESPSALGGNACTLKFCGFDSANRPLISGLPGSPDAVMPARSTVALNAHSEGTGVVVLFEEGDPHRPIIVGVLHEHPATAAVLEATTPVTVKIDNDRLVLSAEREIELSCGAAKITLTRSGKILIQGAYVSSRSSGVNRIKGGSVQIN